MMRIGDEVFIRGYIDEIRSNGVVIIESDGGYFGVVKDSIYTKEEIMNEEDNMSSMQS